MLKIVISGGQCGSDLGGLMAAELFGIPMSGTMPKGFITQSGPRPEWAVRFNLKESTSPLYPPRTISNVNDSDGTIRLAGDFSSAGEKLTLRAINSLKKPHIDVDLTKQRPVSDIVDWINRHNIETLNVAGNSETSYHGACGETIEYLSRVFIALGFMEIKQCITMK